MTDSPWNAVGREGDGGWDTTLTDRQTNTRTDIATYRLNWPAGGRKRRSLKRKRRKRRGNERRKTMKRRRRRLWIPQGMQWGMVGQHTDSQTDRQTDIQTS